MYEFLLCKALPFFLMKSSFSQILLQTNTTTISSIRWPIVSEDNVGLDLQYFHRKYN